MYIYATAKFRMNYDLSTSFPTSHCRGLNMNIYLIHVLNLQECFNKSVN